MGIHKMFWVSGNYDVKLKTIFVRSILPKEISEYSPVTSA